MLRWGNIFMLLFATLLLTGFGKSKVDLAQGVWRSEELDGGAYRYLEIGKDYISIEGKREEGLVLEEKEGVVIVRKAGVDDRIARIIFHDDTHITFEMPFGGLKCVRSSVEEMKKEFTPPVENIIGQYRSEDGKLIIQIAKDAVFKNGKKLDARLVSGNRQYYVLNGNKQEFAFVPRGKDSLRYEESVLATTTLTKIPDDEARQLLDQKVGEQQAARDMLSKARGVWVMKHDDRYSPWVTMEITENTLTRKKEVTPIVGKVTDDMAFLCHADKPDDTVLSLKSISDDGMRLTVMAGGGGAFSFSRDEEYERTTLDEIRLRNELQLADVEGFWQLEDTSAPVYRLLAFQGNHLMRDRHVEELEALPSNAILRLVRPGTAKQFEMMRVYHPAQDKIEVRLGRYDSDGWFTYRRLSNAEGQAAVNQSIGNVVRLPGYWKSAEPIRKGAHGYLAILPNQTIKGTRMDVLEHFNVDEYAKKTVQVPGFLGYSDGNISKPVYLLNDTGRPMGHEFTLIDNHTLDYRQDRTTIRFIRVNEMDATTLIENRRK